MEEREPSNPVADFATAELVGTLCILAIVLIVVLHFRPELLESRGGRVLAFFALFLLPAAAMRSGFALHFESSKQTEFCMSCHVMEPYGQSLLVDDLESVPAHHFQNRRIERDTACFKCHTNYTMFGDMKAKMNGLRHLLVYYSGRSPDEIELYQPYNNRECLYCHVSARRFEELHEYDMAELVANETSCMSCHGSAHDVHQLAGKTMWGESVLKALNDSKRYAH